MLLPSNFDNCLHAIGLSKFYYDVEEKNWVLRDVNLKLKPKEITLVFGPSGCGKTTLILILGLIEQLDKGKLLWKNIFINELSENKKAEIRGRDISIVFQDLHLIPYLSVIENITLPLDLLGIKHLEDNFLLDILESLEIEHLIDCSINHISTGEKQRAAIARTLITRPRVLLLDEPTSHLDKVTGNNVMKILRDLTEEYEWTILITSHDKSIQKIADNVSLLKEGHLIPKRR